MKILVVMGTRPEAIKMAPVIRALRKQPNTFDVGVCVTAQHRELLDHVVSAFAIRVDYDLNLMTHDQSIADITSNVLQGMAKVIGEFCPDLVLVHGDTATSFATALACYYGKVPVGHVEAGLRSGNKFGPFPEEMHRILVDALCEYHYVPTLAAKENLLRENVAESAILVTGNTVIDALLEVSEQEYTFSDPTLRSLGQERRLILVTAHRRESFGAPLEAICTAIRDLARANPDIEFVYPVHPNPNVLKTVNTLLQHEERVTLIAPLDYVAFVHLLKKSAILLTDSGGIQEEAPALGKPVLVMRATTERQEALDSGTSLLVGNTYDGVVHNLQQLLDDPERYAAMATAARPFGDGQASQRIVEHLSTLASTLS